MDGVSLGVGGSPDTNGGPDGGGVGGGSDMDCSLFVSRTGSARTVPIHAPSAPPLVHLPRRPLPMGPHYDGGYNDPATQDRTRQRRLSDTFHQNQSTLCSHACSPRTTSASQVTHARPMPHAILSRSHTTRRTHHARPTRRRSHFTLFHLFSFYFLFFCRPPSYGNSSLITPLSSLHSQGRPTKGLRLFWVRARQPTHYVLGSDQVRRFLPIQAVYL
jgi:hypothetical protein